MGCGSLCLPVLCFTKDMTTALIVHAYRGGKKVGTSTGGRGRIDAGEEERRRSGYHPLSPQTTKQPTNPTQPTWTRESLGLYVHMYYYFEEINGLIGGAGEKKRREGQRTSERGKGRIRRVRKGSSPAPILFVHARRKVDGEAN